MTGRRSNSHCVVKKVKIPSDNIFFPFLGGGGQGPLSPLYYGHASVRPPFHFACTVYRFHPNFISKTWKRFKFPLTASFFPISRGGGDAPSPLPHHGHAPARSPHSILHVCLSPPPKFSNKWPNIECLSQFLCLFVDWRQCGNTLALC